jgi:hypothetical protein
VFLLITGASGVGKSTTRAMIAPSLAPAVESIELTQLEPMPTTGALSWRQRTTELAVRHAIALQQSGRHLLLAGDPVAAIELAAAPSAPRLGRIAICLLDASADAQAARLSARGDDPATLVHHRAFADWMREQATNPLYLPHVVADHGWDQMRWDRLTQLVTTWQMETIDTSFLSRQAVAAEVLGWARRSLAGAAPAIQIGSV